MTSQENTIMIVSLIAFRLAIYAGCAWLVWGGWSPWWFVLAIAVAQSTTLEKVRDE